MAGIQKTSPEAVADGSAQAPVSLQDMIERRVPFEWYESVAMVASLCDAIADQDTPAVPPPHDVMVTAAGEVIVGGSRSGGGVTELPRILNTLLEASAPPAPLRLFVLHAISSASHPSPRSFGGALAYYERPGRAALVEAAYRRYVQTPAPSETPEAAPEAPALGLLADDTPAEPPRPRRTRRLALALLATLICAAAIPLLFAAARRQPPLPASDHPGTLRSVVAHVHGAAATVAAAVTAAFTREPSPPVPAVVPAEANQRPVRVRRHIELAAIPASGGEPSVASLEGVEGPGDSAIAGAHPVDAEIYSPEVASVVPPVLVDPVRLPSAPGGARPGTSHVIELIVGETGNVDRVRLLSPTSQMTDMMLLSAAKSWIFEPARRDGHPVKYRLTFTWITPTP